MQEDDEKHDPWKDFEPYTEEKEQLPIWKERLINLIGPISIGILSFIISGTTAFIFLGRTLRGASHNSNTPATVFVGGGIVGLIFVAIWFFCKKPPYSDE